MKYWNINGEVFRAMKLRTALFEFAYHMNNEHFIDIKVRPAYSKDFSFEAYCCKCKEYITHKDRKEGKKIIDYCTKCGKNLFEN